MKHEQVNKGGVYLNTVCCTADVCHQLKRCNCNVEKDLSTNESMISNSSNMFDLRT